MRRGKVALVLAVFAGALALTSLAEARVGSGGSSGSRGSRSYSAPRAPSAPVSPSSPTAPSRSLPQTPQPVPQRPGGLFGGWGGMLGGLLVGGLLGSLLFGGGYGGGGGGIGLVEILLVAGLAYLAFTFLRRRQPEPAVASGYGTGRSATDWAPAAPAEAAAPEPRRGAALFGDDLEQGLAAIRVMDPGFDPARMTAVASDFFVRLQAAWTARDLTNVRALLTDEMATTLETDLGKLRAQRRVNRVEQVKVEEVELTEAWQEYGRDLVTLRLHATALDSTVDEATGAVVEGSASTPASFEEYWTFARPVGPQSWQLAAIQQPPA